METFGERLTYLRNKKRMSVKTLAARCRLLPLELAAMERMENADCTGTQLVVLCIALGSSVIWLALGIGSPEPSPIGNIRKLTV